MGSCSVPKKPFPPQPDLSKPMVKPAASFRIDPSHRRRIIKLRRLIFRSQSFERRFPVDPADALSGFACLAIDFVANLTNVLSELIPPLAETTSYVRQSFRTEHDQDQGENQNDLPSTQIKNGETTKAFRRDLHFNPTIRSNTQEKPAAPARMLDDDHPVAPRQKACLI